jgi:hypothetical protein
MNGRALRRRLQRVARERVPAAKPGGKVAPYSRPLSAFNPTGIRFRLGLVVLKRAKV